MGVDRQPHHTAKCGVVSQKVVDLALAPRSFSLMRIATIEVKVPRHSSANSPNPIKHHVRVRRTDQLESTILGNSDFNLGAFPEVKRLCDRSRYPNRQTVSPLGNLHATNPNIYRRTNVYLPAKAIQACRVVRAARRGRR